MVFSSLLFLFFFLPLFLILYYAVPKRFRNYILLLASLVFYAWGEPIYVFLMLFMTLSDFLIGRLMQHYDGNDKMRKVCLIASVTIDIGCLVFFKYIDFLTGNINGIFRVNLPMANIALPIGISFFTFQTLSYVIDLYRREVKAESSYFDYITYVSMFPQLIAGPIVRYSTIKDELHNRTVTQEGFFDGLIRFIYGLLKKVLIANRVGGMWDEVLASNPGDRTMLLAWLGAIAFTLQLYFDFSAYSDMAIGLGKMLGFGFPENFSYPLCATSVTDFWRRWHISLSSWFRDYVYIPLGGNRKGVARQIFNISVVWLLTGLWHGASWNFVLWGVYYGVLLILEKFIWGKALNKVPAFFRHLYLVVIVVLGFTLFAIEDFGQLSAYLHSMFTCSNGFADSDVLYYIRNYGVSILAAVVLSAPVFPWIKEKVSNGSSKISKAVSFAWMPILVILVICAVSYMVADTYNPFLYFRF